MKQNSLDKFPYNPSDVDIRQQSFSVDMIVDMIQEGEIELWRPNDYQRLSGLWSIKEKSRLIESILMNIPLPIFYLDGSRRPWKIIDGLQRLTVLHEFINKQSFVLTDLEYKLGNEGSRYNDLPFRYQRQIRNFVIQAYIINPGTPEEVKFNIFQRINTFGIRLNAQEIRNGYFSGIPSSFIYDLAQLPAFKNTIGKHISAKRMKDREYILRFLAFYNNLQSYHPPMEKFLDNSMQQLESLNRDTLDRIKHSFNSALETCYGLLGEDAFFILNDKGHRLTTKPNIALFETWTVNISHKTDAEQRRLVEGKDWIPILYYNHLQSRPFYSAITSNTTSKKSVKYRFDIVSDLIETIIQNDQSS